jgi:hypothetical protein
MGGVDMLDAQLKAKLPKFSRYKTKHYPIPQSTDGEFKKYHLLKSLCGRPSRGLSEGNHPNKPRKRVHT